MDYSDSRDHAKGGMPLHELERLLEDMENEPDWRPSANKCADYYDHKQSDQKRIERHAKTGEPMVTVNLIQRTINGALGQEAKTRLAWKAAADTGAFSEVAAAMNDRLHEFQREAKTDMAISEAYSSMLRTGIGWVEVSRNPDPLAYYGRAVAVHRNEVWWDWRAKLSDKSDARWMCRQRWVDMDEAINAMPKFKQLLELGTHSGPITDAMARTILTTRDQFEDIYATRRSFSRVEEEWLDNSVRKRVRFYSVYYKSPIQAVALVAGTKRVKFNPQNRLHAMLVQMGGAKLVKGPSFEIRHAMFAGPFRLFDEPIKGRRFPLVPFVCYSADDDRSPYGLVHGMIEPQDEFNKRRSRLLWLLEAKQVFVDNDALDQQYNTFAQLAAEVMRPDAMFVMNAARQNKAGGLEVRMNLQMSKEQAEVMQDAKVLIQDQPGLFSPQFGSNSIGAESGVALNNLTEMSTASLGETSDNYRTSRQACGELAMGLIAEDMAEPNMRVEIGTGKKRRVVVLNTVNEQGIPVNQVEDSEVRVALGDVPSTPAFRAQQGAYLANALNTVGDDQAARAVLLPALLEASEIENGREYAKWLRKQYGVPEPTDLTDDAAQEQAERQQAQQAAAGQELQVRAAVADVAKKEADADLTGAKAIVEQAKAEQIIVGSAVNARNQALQERQQQAAEVQQSHQMAQDARGNEDDMLIQQAMAEALGPQQQQPGLR